MTEDVTWHLRHRNILRLGRREKLESRDESTFRYVERATRLHFHDYASSLDAFHGLVNASEFHDFDPYSTRSIS